MTEHAHEEERPSEEEINEYRKKWLAQLRDPKSKKAIGKLEDLKNHNKRCCLGHACHALGVTRDIDTYTDRVSYDERWGKLPESACRKLNIDRIGRLKNEILAPNRDSNNSYYGNLTMLNDETKLTPQEIADVIEEQFERDNFIPFMYGKMFVVL